MKPEQAIVHIENLTAELNEHNYRYYVLSEPVISDYEFDMKLKELERLEQEFPEFALPDSPTGRVGGEITKVFKPVKHEYPMMSLGNTYSEQEVIDFILQTKKDQPRISVRQLAQTTGQKFQTRISKSSVSNVLKDSSLSSPVGRPSVKSKDKIFTIPQQAKQRIREEIQKVGLTADGPKAESFSRDEEPPENPQGRAQEPNAADIRNIPPVRGDASKDQD
ncbi:MAG: hypothetical protein EOM23_08290, partial [Candidatus Moranbacteria bacterium]|nr:hypothetical protein [Candidatus Moranbacteria bacterium]